MKPKAEHDPETVDTDQPTAAGATDSQPTGAPISLDDATVQAIVNHPVFGQALQGVKDRRFSKIEKGLGDVNQVIEQLNLSPEQREQYDRISQQNLLNQLTKAVFGEEQGQPSSTQPAAEPAARTPIDIVGAYREAGFDPNSLTIEDVDYAETFSDPVELKNALIRKAAQLRGGQPAASPASIPPQGGGRGAPAGNKAKLQKEYDDKKENIKPGDVNALFALKEEYRQKGLDIY